MFQTATVLLLLVAALTGHRAQGKEDFPWLPVFDQDPRKEQLQHVLKLQEQGDFNTALATLDKLSDATPDDPVLWEFRGYFFLQSRSHWQAIQSLRKALFLKPPDPALSRIGQRLIKLYRVLGKHQDAYTIALILTEASSSYETRRWAEVQRRKLNALIQPRQEPIAGLIHSMQAVPTPGAVRIDGKLNDWDLSGQRTACDNVETELPVYKAAIAVMYDRKHVYFAIHYRDWSPMASSIDPLRRRHNSSNGDSAQLKILTKNRVDFFDCWYYRPRKTSAIFHRTGVLRRQRAWFRTQQLYQNSTGQFDKGFAQAFRKDDDGLGYVQEIQLPANAFSLDELTAGESLRVVLELCWGDRHEKGKLGTERKKKGLVTITAEGERRHSAIWRKPTGYGTITLAAKGQLKLPTPEWRQKLVAWGMEGPSFIGHTQAIHDLSFTTDGKQLISAGQDGTVRVWDRATTREVLRYTEHKGSVNAVSIIPGNRLAASAGNDHSVHVWHLLNSKTKLQLKGHEKPVFDLAVSRDGNRLVSGGLDGRVLVWDLTTGKRSMSFQAPAGIRVVAISPDNQYFVGGALNGRIYLWTTEAEKPRILTAHRFGIRDLQFAPGGKVMFSAADDMSILRWKLDTGKVIQRYNGHRSLVTGIVLSPDANQLASCSLDGYLILWDVATGKAAHQRQINQTGLRCLAWPADSRSLAIATRDRVVRMITPPDN